MATKVTDFLQQNPYYVGMANTSNRAKPKEAPKSKKGSGNQSWLSSIISELGGAGGALGGAATGAALGSVVPGIGNIVGGVLGGIAGGFGGGTAGRLAENKIRDNEYRLGDALKEGAVSGALGGIGPAWQGARGLATLGKAGGAGLGARTVTGARALSGMTDDAARVAGQTISRSGKKGAQSILTGAPNLSSMQVAGRGISQNAMGIGQGAKAPGASNLGASQSDDLLKTLTKDLGLKRSNPERMQRSLEPIIKNKGAELANIYGSSTAKYTAPQLKSVADDIVRTLADDASFQPTKAVSQQITKQLKLIQGAKTPQQIWKIQKDLGKSINFGKNVDAKLVDREAVARIMREKLGTLLDEAVPDAKQAKSIYSKAVTADELLRIASKPADKTGITAMVRTSGAFRNAEAKTGGLVEALGGPGVANAGRLVRGTVARGIVNPMLQPMGEVPTEDVPVDDALYGPGFASGIPEMGAGMGQMPQSQGAPASYSLEQAMADIQNDPKNAATYKWVYDKSLAAEKGTTLSAQEKKSQKQAQTALAGLTQLRQLFDQAGGGQNRLPGILGNVQGKLGANSKADSYNKIRDSLTTSLARAFGETGVLTDQDREVYKQALPRLEDTPEEAQIKLQYLEDMLAGGSQPLELDYGTPADLSSIISQYGGY